MPSLYQLVNLIEPNQNKNLITNINIIIIIKQVIIQQNISMQPSHSLKIKKNKNIYMININKLIKN